MKTFVLLILLNFLLFNFSSAKADNTETLKTPEQSGNPKQSTWEIHNSKVQETGFFIDENHVITDFSVIASNYLNGETNKDYQEPVEKVFDRKSVVNLTLSKKGNPSVIKVKNVIAVSAPHNLALLETEEGVTHYLSFRQHSPKASEPLSIIAYPYPYEGLKQIKKTENILFENGLFYIFPIKHPALHGSNGSPVVDKKGQVVGVLFSGYMSKAYAIKTDHLKEFVKGNIGLHCSNFINSESCIKKELENLKKAAEDGDPAAQFNLARIYYHDEINKQNLELAFKWFEKAALQGFDPAKYNLAIMHANGMGVEKSPTLALQWFEESGQEIDKGKDPSIFRCQSSFTEQ